MPNRLTTVPAGTVPPPRRLASALLPFADAFMLVMVSRPATGSLRNTWVTPATLWLALAACAIAAALAVVLATGAATSAGALAVVGTALCAAYAVGAGAVLVVALDQRRRLR